MNKSLKTIILLLAFLTVASIDYAQAPLKKPEKKTKIEHTNNQSTRKRENVHRQADIRKREEARRQEETKREEARRQEEDERKREEARQQEDALHQEELRQQEEISSQEDANRLEESREQEELRKYKGHEYVDLGLPSGLKWATCNVGAKIPEEYGTYFAWGEIIPKTSYDKDNSKTYGNDDSWLLQNGYIDSYGNLTMSHDAARQNWGGSWRLPTRLEVDELIANTTAEWVTYNGVSGCLVTSKINGMTIFLPAAGSRHNTEFYGGGSSGDYWTSTYGGDIVSGAYNLGLSPGDFRRYWSSRGRGRSVRPVAE